jgi:hypothetical protein
MCCDRFADRRELIERRLEHTLLHDAADGRGQDDEAGMQRLLGIELPEIARVVGGENEIALAGIADDIPIFPAGAADTGDVLGFMASFPGDSGEVNAEAFVDQKSHDTAMATSFLRLVCTGC